MFKYTKIGVTIGPSCQEVEILVNMVKAGMNFARLNFSHGDYDSHKKMIENIRKVEKITGEPIAIMQDLHGPKIRLGILPGVGVKIEKDKEVVLNTAIKNYTARELPIDCEVLHQFLNKKERVLIDDGRMELVIKKIEGAKIICQVIEGGVLYSHKGLNLPDSKLNISPLGEKDKEDIKFGIKNGVDTIAMSFVTCAKDILDLRFLIKQCEQELKIANARPIQIFAKIERHEAVDNIKEILEATDGIIVARGDLGLEMPAAEVPLAQKMIIDISNAAAKPVIVATQMLDSMRVNRRPTRAEVSDVANAVIDHSDALLLTNETATGDFPLLVVETMTNIILATEKSVYDDTSLPSIRKKGTAVDTAITELSRVLAEEVSAKLILAATITGETGRLISHVRPLLPILVATSDQKVWRQLNITWGVKPFQLEPCHSIEELVERSIMYIKKNKIAKKNDLMIVVAGEPVGQAGKVNLVEVREIN